MEEIKTVNLYIDTSVRGPRKINGAYGFVLETSTAAGPATFTKVTKLDETTEHQSLCKAIREALQRIKKPCRVVVHTQSEYIVAAIKFWLQTWKDSDWLNAKGKEVADADSWQEIASRYEIELDAVIDITHQYKEWLCSETKRAAK